MRTGYFLATEEFTPRELLDQAELAQETGFEALWISDHFHPWNDVQGNSPFVWSVIGALAEACELPVTTAVTCPTVRIHPAVIAQAAATSAVLHNGRFRLGVGTGEALNEHVLGDRWPPADVRLSMLEEAVELMRKLWTGEFVDHHGEHYTVEHARIYTLPDETPPVYVSGFGPKAVDVAARIGDGFMTVAPDAEAVHRFREHGGGAKPAQGGYKVCWAPTAGEAAEIAHERWPNMALPGELGQVLPSPRHFEQATTLVTRDAMADMIVCGPDAEAHRTVLDRYAKAGFDEVYVGNIGPYQREFFEFYAEEVLGRA